MRAKFGRDSKKVSFKFIIGFFKLTTGFIYITKKFSMTFGKCNIICRYIFVDCKIDGKHCQSRRESAAFWAPKYKFMNQMAPNYVGS